MLFNQDNYKLIILPNRYLEANRVIFSSRPTIFFLGNLFLPKSFNITHINSNNKYMPGQVCWYSRFAWTIKQVLLSLNPQANNITKVKFNVIFKHANLHKTFGPTKILISVYFSIIFRNFLQTWTIVTFLWTNWSS